MFSFTSLLMLNFSGTKLCPTQQPPRQTSSTIFASVQLMNCKPSSLLPQLHFSSHAARRADLTDPVQMDLHFPLFCTPYYGFVPEDMTDMHIELLQLSARPSSHSIHPPTPRRLGRRYSTVPLFPSGHTCRPLPGKDHHSAGRGCFSPPVFRPRWRKPSSVLLAQPSTWANSLCSSPLPPPGVDTHCTLI